MQVRLLTAFSVFDCDYLIMYAKLNNKSITMYTKNLPTIVH